MGIQSYPAASSGGSAGLIAQRPKFTYVKKYNLSGSLSGLFQVDYTSSKLVFSTYTNSIYWVGRNDTSTSALAEWALGASTASLYSLPNTGVMGHDLELSPGGRLWFSNNASGTSNYIYSCNAATGASSSWTNRMSSTYGATLFPVPTLSTDSPNGTDALGVGFFNANVAGNTPMVWNENTGSYVSLNMYTGAQTGTFNNISDSSRWHQVTPIRRGDDEITHFDGYMNFDGTSAEGHRYVGTRHVMSPINFPNGPRYNGYCASAASMPEGYVNNSTYNTWDYYHYNMSGRYTSIESRWIISTYGGYTLFDTMTQTYVGGATLPMYPYIGGIQNRPVYISATKKLYVYQSSNLSMYEYDVTFA